MEELVEFIFTESMASDFLLPTDGEEVSGGGRKVVARVGDSLYERIRHGDKLLLQPKPAGRDAHIYSYWRVIRRYTEDEIQSASLFTLFLKRTFHFSGEEYGTIYLEDKACPLCGGGATRVGPLVLDLRKAPKTHDIAVTLAHEHIVSQKLAECCIEQKITGCELRPVVHRSFRKEPPTDFSVTPTGQRLLEEAKMEGVTDWHLYVWLYGAGREARTRLAEQEFRKLLRLKEYKSPPLPRWYELLFNSRPVRTVKPTRWGRDIFEHRPPREYTVPWISVRSNLRGRWDRWPNGDVCPHGGQYDHVKDLRILSEAFASREDWDGSDVCRSVELRGYRMGLLRPSPYCFVSRKLRELLITHAKDYVELELAHLN